MTKSGIDQPPKNLFFSLSFVFGLALVFTIALTRFLPTQFLTNSMGVNFLSLSLVLFLILVYSERISSQTLVDITSRYEEGEERFRQIAENLRDQVFYIAPATRDHLLYISPSFEQVWGYPVETVIANPMAALDWILPEDRTKLQNAILAQGRGERTTTEFRFLHADGSTHWILDRTFPVRDKSGEVRRICGLAEDITAQKLADLEKELAAKKLEVSNDKYLRLFLSNPQPMWILDRENCRFLEVNEAAVQAFGYSRDELIQMCPRDLDTTIFGRGENRCVVKRKDGRVMHVEVNANDFIYEGQEARIAALNDVTEMVLARTSAIDASEAKSRFLANMSHEIRTPLAAILGFAELMEDPAQSASDRLECLATIRRNGAQLSCVINDVLDLSKIESNRFDVEKIIFSPIKLLEEVITLLKVQAHAKDLDLLVKSEGFLPFRICTDPTRLRQILINIVGNAIKFTSVGKIEVNVRQVSGPDQETLRFVVRDNGPGIPEKHQQKLFKPFAQADESTARIFGGTGLGLTLSKRLAKALGGDVRLLESLEGEGSAFEITIAIGTRMELANLAARAQSSDEIVDHFDAVQLSLGGTHAQALADFRVLLVDDTPDNRTLVSRYLKAEGARVECAEDGETAIEKAVPGRYDVILMDIQMPKMDGFKAVELLRARNVLSPVIALTAHAMKGDRERCLSAGFDDYVMKPVDRRTLAETILRHRPEVLDLPAHAADTASERPFAHH